jgi:hypothetical protein
MTPARMRCLDNANVKFAARVHILCLVSSVSGTTDCAALRETQLVVQC